MLESEVTAMGVLSDHWDSVYGALPVDELSWFQAEPTRSLELIRSLRPRPTSVIDVGAGASLLADRMVDDGVDRVTVLDISERALASASERLGDHPEVSFVVADVTGWIPQQTWDLWHDRAVFHFLTEPADRTAYTKICAQAVVPGGVAVIGCFALGGPTHCSGLPIVQYGPETLAAEFSPEFELERSEHEVHRTPSGVTQPFTWVVMRRRPQA
jgi:SAM-dependent methyltransferase